MKLFSGFDEIIMTTIFSQSIQIGNEIYCWYVCFDIVAVVVLL